MQNLLIIHNKYSNFGGEDSNYESEVENLSKNYNVYEYTKKNSNNINFGIVLNLIFLTNIKANRDIAKLIKKK